MATLMPAFLKGIVMERRNGAVNIELKTGRRFWTLPKTPLRLRQYVWVGWDYTHNRPTQVLTQAELDALPDEIGLEEPELGVFSTPDDEGFGVSEPVGAEADIPLKHGFVDIRDDNSEPGAFSDPWGEERGG